MEVTREGIIREVGATGEATTTTTKVKSTEEVIFQYLSFQVINLES